MKCRRARPPARFATADDPNSLQLAFRSRIKLFFRPAGLTGNADEAAAKVSWKFVRKDNGGYALEATNPTPYHVTFSKIVVSESTTNWTSDKGGMVDPGGSADFDVGNVTPLADVPAQVNYTFINDYGAGVNGKTLRDETRK